MNFEQARYNMIKQQFRPWHVCDAQTLDLVTEIHREDFIPAPYRNLALADINIPLLHGQVTMAPKIEARLLQSLAIQGNDQILEIGTGCGYLTALLAKLGGVVHSVDIYPEFTAMAATALKLYNLHNVVLHTGDANNGWAVHAPYDVIAITGSMPVLNDAFQLQLKTGGRLFMIIGTSPAMQVKLIRRLGEEEWSHEDLFETDLPPLIGAIRQPTFNF
jgi:protein-L-isoaspartate(D-aspartate) O-methyltransferase